MVDSAGTRHLNTFIGGSGFLTPIWEVAPALEVAALPDFEDIDPQGIAAPLVAANSAKHQATIPTLFYGSHTKALDGKRDSDGLVLLWDHVRLGAFGLIPGRFPGLPYDAPTRARITMSLLWSQNGGPTVGSPPDGERSVRTAWSASLSGLKAKAGDVAYAMVSTHSGGAKTLKFGAADATPIPGVGIYRLGRAAAASTTLALTASSGMSGVLYIGSEVKVNV